MGRVPYQPLVGMAGDAGTACALVCQAHAVFSRDILKIKPQAALGLSSGETNALVAFGNPGFKGADGKIWDKDRIVLYLKTNYIALMSYPT